jgi:hypothetical protein
MIRRILFFGPAGLCIIGFILAFTCPVVANIPVPNWINDSLWPELIGAFSGLLLGWGLDE